MPTVRSGTPKFPPPRPDALAEIGLTRRGRRNFDALQVGDQDVRPFLDKTDGEKLVDSAGLDTGVVGTSKIATSAVTEALGSFTAGTQTLTGTTPCQVQSHTRTTSGYDVDVDVSFFMTVHHPTAGGIDATLQVKRDGVDIISPIVIPAVGGDIIQGWQSFSVPDAPPAGEHTWTVWVTLSNNDAATQTALASRLRVREFKR